MARRAFPDITATRLSRRLKHIDNEFQWLASASDVQGRSLARAIAPSLDRSTARSIARSLARSLNRSLDRSIARSLAGSFARSLDRSLDRSVGRSLDRSLMLGVLSFCPREDQENPNSFMDGALGTRHAWGWLETRALTILTRANSIHSSNSAYPRSSKSKVNFAPV